MYLNNQNYIYNLKQYFEINNLKLINMNNIEMNKNYNASNDVSSPNIGDNNKNIEAADYFIEKINQTFSKKEQVTIILELIETFKDYKYKDLIYHYLDYLLEILEEFKLYKWDPSLAVKIYKVIINAMETIDYRIESTSFLKIKKKLLKLDFASYINLLNKDV